MDLTTTTVEPRVVDAGRGIAWWTEGWALFTKNAGMWIVLGLITLVIFVVLSFIPVLGSLALALLGPVLIGSWMRAARKVEDGGALEVNDLFTAFNDKLQPLAILGALAMVGFLVIGVVIFVLGAGSVMGMIFGGANHSAGGMAAGMGVGMLAVLIAMLMGFLVSMALWYAPALVVFRGVAPVDAVKASFNASLKNIIPFLLYSIVYFVAAVVASIPAGLGWVLLVPVLLLTMYTSYKDVFAG